MELTSEVERILNGTLVMTDKPIKAIQVSSTTVKPNADGIVPLSKQDALKVLPISSVPPVLEDPKISDVVEEVPIEVASPESLESFSIDLDKPLQESDKEKREEPIKEETPIEISLPEMQPVVAQEPTTVNDSLFVDSDKTEESIALESVVPTIPGDTKQEEVKEELSVEKNISPAVEENAQSLDNPLDTDLSGGFLVPDLMFSSEENKTPETLDEPKQEATEGLQIDLPKETLNSTQETVDTVTPALDTKEKESSNLQFANSNEINEYVNKFVEEMKKDFDSKIELFKNSIFELIQNKSKSISVEKPTIPTIPEDETINALDFISSAPEVQTEETNFSSPTIPVVPSLNDNNDQKIEDSVELPTIDEVKSTESNDDMQIKGMFI